MLYSHVPYHNDTITKTLAMIKTLETFFIKIYTSHFIVRVRKGCSRFACERELGTEHNWNILTPNLWPSRCIFLVLLMLNRRPRGSLCWVICYIFSATSQVPEGLLGWVWLSLPHLDSNSVRSSTQLSSVLFVGLILPSNSHVEIWERHHTSAISSDIWRSGCVTSAIFGMAFVIVIERI